MTAVAPRISNTNLSVSGGVKHRPVLGHRLQEKGISDRFGLHQIHISEKQVLQIAKQPEVRLCVRRGIERLKDDEEIDIAGRRIEVATI